MWEQAIEKIGFLPELTLSHSTLLMALSKVEGLAEGVEMTNTDFSSFYETIKIDEPANAHDAKRWPATGHDRLGSRHDIPFQQTIRR